MRYLTIILLTALAATLWACGNSTSTSTTTATAPTAEDRIKQDLKAAGADIKAAATEAATQVKPALHEAGEKSREAVHTAAEKVAQWTESQPATAKP